MAQRAEQGRHGVDAIAGAAREAARKGPPPVHLWNPPFCGDLDMRVVADGRVLYFRTNVDDWVACGREHALRFEPEPETAGLKPYLHVRRDLWAKLTRALFYDLVELGEERDVKGQRMFGVASAGEFFAMAPAASLRELR